MWVYHFFNCDFMYAFADSISNGYAARDIYHSLAIYIHWMAYWQSDAKGKRGRIMYKYALTFLGGLVAGIVAVNVIEKFRNKEFEEPDAVESWEDFREEEDLNRDDYVTGHEGEDAVDLQAEKKDYSNYTEEYAAGLSDYYVDSSKNEHPDEEEEGEFVEVPNEDKEVKKYKKPRLIKEEEFGELSGYECQTLKYYVEDDVLCTEENEKLDEEYYLGDAMNKFGFKDNPDESEIFVRNSGLGMDFNVCKVFGAYSELFDR